MRILARKEKPESTKTEGLVLGHFENDKFRYEAVDRKLNKRISKSIKTKKFTGEFGKMQSFSSLGLLPSEKILLVGLGKKKEFSLDKLRKVSASAAKVFREAKIKEFSTSLTDVEVKGKPLEQVSQTIVEGSVLGLYHFDNYKTSQKDKKKKMQKMVILTKDVGLVSKSVKKAEIVSHAVNYVRDLVNTPAKDATPTFMANEAKRLSRKHKFKIKVLGKREMQRKKMGAILGVSRGSSQEPKLVLMETNPKAKKTIAIVGKGITFDSGGLNLKPGDYMFTMKSDMAGSAVVLGTIASIAQMNLPINVLGVMALSENMTGASAQKPGDIITAYNGKTIEIGNTDAEGRLVLADAVAYASEYNPEALIDVATLTGAVVVTLGYSAAALVSNNDKLKASLKKSSESTAERLWELPLWDDYREGVKGELADLRNMGRLGKGYEAGTLVAATFIENFVKKDIPWAHLDIAGVSYINEQKEYLPKNATGFGVRLLVNLFENWK